MLIYQKYIVIELLKDELLKDDILGLLQLGNGKIIPNHLLQIKIYRYSDNVIANLLNKNPGIIDIWLQKLRSKYIKNLENCEFGTDLTECFHLGIYKIFEVNFESWNKGRAIKIDLGNNKIIYLTKNSPPFTLKNQTNYLQRVTLYQEFS